MPTQHPTPSYKNKLQHNLDQGSLIKLYVKHIDMDKQIWCFDILFIYFSYALTLFHVKIDIYKLFYLGQIVWVRWPSMKLD